jgi:uncharacterized alpha-E superfamily protein
MLIRIAENLYWTGRYIKRSAYLAKYLRVQYFSTLDASMSQNLEFTLRSILNMNGIQYDSNETLDHYRVITKVSFDPDEPSSIFSTVFAARENTRSLRHLLSSEMFESVNKLYHFTKDFDQEYYRQRGLFEFTTKIEEYVKIIRSDMQTTILREDEYNFLMMGVWIENCNQILRILKSKLIDTDILSDNGENIPVMQYQWTITLKTLESFDMHNRYYQNQTTIKSVVEFLISNGKYPRSFYYNLSHLLVTISKVGIIPEGLSKLKHEVAKLESKARFFEYEGNSELHDFLDKSIQSIETIHDICTSLYFDRGSYDGESNTQTQSQTR